MYTVLNDELDYNESVGNNDIVNVYSDHSDHVDIKLIHGRKKRHRRGKKRRKNNNFRSQCNTIKIAFNNVNRLRPKIHEVDKLLKDEQFDIFGIAESFLNKNDVVNLHGYKWLGKNRITKGGGGIGFFISDSVCIVEEDMFNSSSDVYERLWVKVCFGKDKPMYIAVTYFPVEGTDPNTTDELYGQLLSEVLRIEDQEDNPCILIMGDMNGRIGREISDGDPVCNSNGKRLLSFRDDSNLSIINCSNLCSGKITWCRGNQKSTIDYMMSSDNLMNRVYEMIVDEERKYGLGSDHNVLLLRGKHSTVIRPRCNSILR